MFSTIEKKQTNANTKIITELRKNSKPQMVTFLDCGNNFTIDSNETFSGAGGKSYAN
ncbi:hypothetical protein FACS189416_6630 [Bacteroidia bacterium]|nr:hypothetical protein FACS189416_6630 [Bacteroidia bacterium]